MDKENNLLHHCHKLLHNVLMDGFRTEVLLFEYPYQDLTRIDQGFRATVWNNYNDDESKIGNSIQDSKFRLFLVKSNLGFYNILILFPFKERPDFITVGPFRDEELSANYYTNILKTAHLATSTIQDMKALYEKMPYADPEVLLKLVKHIVSNSFPEFEEVPVDYIEYSEQNREASVNPDLMKNYSMENTSMYKELLFSFLEFIIDGDLANARIALNNFINANKLLGGKNLREDKQILHMLNDYCHLALLNTSIHPSYVMGQAFSVRSRIDDASSVNRLNQVANDICRKYCLLVQNHANRQYTKSTRDIIDYIHLHLDENLSLSYLADEFDKNASAMSSAFSKDTGVTITKYIQQTRIQEAIRLFNSTDLSISDVAVSVGYQDFSYFSKIFTKEIGCSPRTYKMSKNL